MTKHLLASFPKSGSTWVRYVLAYYFHGREKLVWDMTGNNIFLTSLQFDCVPSSPRYCCQTSTDFPIYIKTHAHIENGEWDAMSEPDAEVLKTLKTDSQYLIVRNPMDVAISYFNFNMRASDQFKIVKVPMEQWIDDFVDVGIFNSIENKLGFWDIWHENWLNLYPEIKIIRYEDLLENPHPIIRSMITDAGLEVYEKQLDEAINFCSFKNLKKLEMNSQFYIKFQMEAKKPEQLEYRFFKNGTKNTFKQHFTEEQVAKYYDKFGHIMQRLGYNINTL